MKLILLLLLIPFLAFPQSTKLDGNYVFQSTGYIQVPVGTTGERVAGEDGFLRFNSTLNIFEGYLNGAYSEFGGGGQGGINYLADTKDSDFEISIGNWVAFDDGAVSVPVDGTGGSPTLTCTRDATSKLEKVGSMKLLAAASDMQGEGCSADFDIDTGMKGQKLTLSAWVDTTTANYADDDVAWFVYDKTNANLIRINGEDVKGTSGKIYAQFQAASDSTSYRLIYMVTNTATLGYSIYFDQIAVGPTNIARGSPQTDMVAYTPTVAGGATISSNSAYYKRFGDTLLVQGRFFVSSGGSTTLTISIPSGLLIDSAKIASTSQSSVGSAFWSDSGTGFFTLNPRSNDSTTVAFYQEGGGGSFSAGSLAVNDVISYSFSVPIVGWSAGAQMSSDLGGREIYAHYKTSTTTSYATGVTIDYDTLVKESNASDYSGGVYTVPETGRYMVSASIRTTTIANPIIAIKIDSTQQTYASAATSGEVISVTETFYVTKGQTLSIANASTAFTPTGDARYNKLSITKLASPQTKFDDATVAARYTSSNGLPTHAKDVTVAMIYEELVYDTHGAYNTTTGDYTTPVSGKYSITCMTRLNTLVMVATDFIISRICVDAVCSDGYHTATGSATIDYSAFSTDIRQLDKGAVVTCESYQTTANTVSPNTVSRDNYFAIARIK